MSASAKRYRFAVVPKETDNPFYDQVLEGCVEMAGLLSNVECLYVGPDHVDAADQAEIIRSLISGNSVDGISMAVIDEGIAEELAQEALDSNIPFITFDSDAPNSKRLVYVGTDNFEFGQSLAKVLLQLSPAGGIYGIIDAKPPNVALRSAGIRHRMKNSRWTESTASPKDCDDSIELSLQHMRDYAALAPNINAIIPVGGWPMRDATNWKLFVDANRNLTLNVGDTDPDQLNLLAKTYVDGLVGQVPYQMGTESIRLLMEISTGKAITQELITTSLVEVVRIPLSLPAVTVDNNQYGGLRYIGIAAATILFCGAVAAATFTFKSRSKRVIKASQPFFLYLICAGVLIMASSLIPLSVDDSWPHHTQRGCNIACMTFPWLLAIGFTTTFSAMFSKTWRVVKIFRTNERFVRQQVSERDVMVPFFSLLGANLLVLSLWTFLSPLEFKRQPHPGTDDWNRVISTYGICTSANSLPYVLTLTFLNLGLLIVANFQAYRARSIQSEFSESKYIGIIMACMLQTCMVGVPILFLVQDNPKAQYLIATFIIFATSMAVLCLMFIPKIYFVRRYGRNRLEAQMSERRRNRASLPKSQFYDQDTGNHNSERSSIVSALTRSVGRKSRAMSTTSSFERDIHGQRIEEASVSSGPSCEVPESESVDKMRDSSFSSMLRDTPASLEPPISESEGERDEDVIGNEQASIFDEEEKSVEK